MKSANPFVFKSPPNERPQAPPKKESADEEGKGKAAETQEKKEEAPAPKHYTVELKEKK